MILQISSREVGHFVYCSCEWVKIFPIVVWDSEYILTKAVALTSGSKKKIKILEILSIYIVTLS